MQDISEKLLSFQDLITWPILIQNLRSFEQELDKLQNDIEFFETTNIIGKSFFCYAREIRWKKYKSKINNASYKKIT